ncbi:MAG: cyclic nucleotide-binding domain protein [Hyphomicrobiales bacterium]|jgi:CRP-like cAMP-binding protein|nr:cyclic nucleotide-binding domain protein [Hyphomicrobiales bacterium]
MATVDDVLKISQIPLFASLEPDALRLIGVAAEIADYPAGSIIFRRGDRSDGGCFVLSGHIGLYSHESDADPVAIVRTGSLIGELALFTATDRPATARALDRVTVANIARGAFKRVLQEHPASSAAIRAALTRRLSGFIQDLHTFDVGSSPEEPIKPGFRKSESNRQ